MKKGRSHKILIFKANGTWQSQVRKEGRLGKVVTKQEEVSGTWIITDQVLHLTITQKVIGGNWNIGDTISWEVVSVTGMELKIKKPSGTIESWMRVKSQKTAGKEVLPRALSLKPIVVNLRKDRPGQKNRYLCIELEFVFKPAPVGTPLPPVHPKVRESAILYLSAQSYSAVNTMPKISKIKGRLLKQLNPYLKGQIERINIKNVAVTSKWESVESFLSKYQNAPAPDKSGKTSDTKNG